MNLKRVETFIIILIIGVAGVIYAFSQNPATSQDESQTAQNSQQSEVKHPTRQVENSAVAYYGVEGKNALELLKASYQVETKEFTGIGEYVVSINGQASDSTTNFWGFYVNGKQSPVGAGQYMTKNDDVIEWKLETITN
jgi:hypothetical protein